MGVKRLSYLVAVPIPKLNKEKRRLTKAKVDKATERLLKAFGEWFGGATAMPCLGTWEMLDGSGMAVDKDQTVVVAMTTRKQFQKFRRRIEQVVGEVGDLLEQGGMAVIAYPTAEGFLLLLESS